MGEGAQPCNPNICESQKACHEFQANQGCRVNSKPAWATERDPVSKTQNSWQVNIYKLKASLVCVYEVPGQRGYIVRPSFNK